MPKQTKQTKRIRRTNAEVDKLISQVKRLTASGMPLTKALEKVNLNYNTYKRRAGKASKTSLVVKGSTAVQEALSNLVKAIRAEVKAEVRGELEAELLAKLAKLTHP